jgi:hypothetical protein
MCLMDGFFCILCYFILAVCGALEAITRFQLIFGSIKKYTIKYNYTSHDS